MNMEEKYARGDDDGGKGAYLLQLIIEILRAVRASKPSLAGSLLGRSAVILRPLIPPGAGVEVEVEVVAEAEAEAVLPGLREKLDCETGERGRLGVVDWRAAEGRMRWPRISISVNPEAWPFSRFMRDSFSRSSFPCTLR